MIGDALGDSTLTLGLWTPERNGYVGTGGAPLELPRDSRARAVTEITRDNRPAAVLIHDPALDTDSDVVEALAASSLMLLENFAAGRGAAESRSRMVDTADHERRRLERDLHDGAQQRLVAIRIKLQLAQEQIDDDQVVAQLKTIDRGGGGGCRGAEKLAHGIYPAVLRSAGVVIALRSFAKTSPVAISVADEGIGRCSPPVEAAIYFCSAEAIQNAIKHAGTNVRVGVTVGRDRDRVHFAISDDGVGIDHSERGDGDGLIGMRDRVGAVGGELESSLRRAGARPCAGRSPRPSPRARTQHRRHLLFTTEGQDLLRRALPAHQAPPRPRATPRCRRGAGATVRGSHMLSGLNRGRAPNGRAVGAPQPP